MNARLFSKRPESAISALQTDSLAPAPELCPYGAQAAGKLALPGICEQALRSVWALIVSARTLPEKWKGLVLPSPLVSGIRRYALTIPNSDDALLRAGEGADGNADEL
jgi:hypothetical protein